MSTPTKTQITRRETVKQRRANIISAGGAQLNVLLQPDVTQKLQDLLNKTGKTKTDLVSDLIRDAHQGIGND